MATSTFFPNLSITQRDYQEGAATFNSNNYFHLPKTKRWFHIYFELNHAALAIVTNALAIKNTVGRVHWDPANLPILGVLAKNIQMPNFKFETKKLNQYNRTSLNVNKINYEPIEINFWDDCVDQISGFWYGYYSYMIQDPKYSNYKARQTQGLPVPAQWDQNFGNVNAGTGYSTLYNSSDNWANHYGLDTVIPGQSQFGRNQPFFKSIRIYKFTRNPISEYGPTYNEFVLVNPIISGFQYDDVDYSSSEFGSNRMSIEYETVLFNRGALSSNNIASWSRVTSTLFDNSPSPLGTGQTALSNPQITVDNAAVLATETAFTGYPYSVQTLAAGASGADAQTTAAIQAAQVNPNTIVSVPFT